MKTILGLGLCLPLNQHYLPLNKTRNYFKIIKSASPSIILIKPFKVKGNSTESECYIK